MGTLGATPLASRRGHTDENGRLSFRGLHAGELAVAFRGKGRAPTERLMRLDANAHKELVVTLEMAAQLRGRVLDEKGEPVASAEVLHGSYGEFLSSFTRSGADGTFHLSELPPGQAHIEVTHKLGSTFFEGFFLAGEERQWDATLEQGRVVQGRVEDEAGAPLGGLDITVLSTLPRKGTNDTWSERLSTEADGSFRFAGCPPGELQLYVEVPHPNKATLARRDIQEGDEELTIVIPDADQPSASVKGLVMDGTGQALGAELRLFGPRLTYRKEITRDGDGRFRFAALSPGDYVLEIHSPEYPTSSLPAFTLGVNQDLDLAEVILNNPGFLTVKAQGLKDTGPFTSFRIIPFDEKSGASPHFPSAEELQNYPVEAGRYVVIGHGPDVAFAQAEISVASGEKTSLELDPRPGQSCEFLWTQIENQEQLAWLSFTLENAEGRRLHGQPLPVDSVPSATLRLEPGRYTIQTVGSGERVRRQSFDVQAGHALRLELDL